MLGKGLPISVAGVVTALVALAIWAPADRAQAAACPYPDTPVAQLTDSAVDSSLYCLINRTRTQLGRRHVRFVESLANAASSYSTWMVEGGYFGHIGSDGSTVITRLQYFGYLLPGLRWIVGENLIWATGPETTPEAIVDSWMLSPDHRRNLLRPGFRDVGVGVSRGTPIDADDGAGITVTTDYGARRR